MIILILKTLGIAFLINKFTPIQWFFEAVLDSNSKIKSSWGIILNLLYVMATCFSCTTFWVGLFIGGFWVALIGYIISYYLSKIIYKLDGGK